MSWLRRARRRRAAGRGAGAPAVGQRDAGRGDPPPRRARHERQPRRRSGSAACCRPSSTRTPTACASAAVDLGEARARRHRLRRAQRRRRPDRRGGAPGRAPARRRQAARRGQAARGREPRHDPLLARARPRRRPLRDHGAGRGARAGHAARRGAAARRDDPRAGDHLQPAGLPGGLRRRARGARGHRRRARAARRVRPAGRGRGRRDATTPPSRCSTPTSARATWPGCSPTCASGRRRAWLARRLEAAGMRAITNVVDVTNYVMLLTGQPLHAFDLDRLAGVEGGRAPRAATGSASSPSTGRSGRSTPSMLAIADGERPAVIAGIFGAEFAEVSEGTTRVLLEAASFDGPTILDTSLDARPAQRVERPLREGPAPRAARARHGGRVAGCWSRSAARPWCRARSTSASRRPRVRR